MSRIRVLLADDHAAILARVRVMLLGHEFEVVGSVDNGQDALREVERLDPDVLVLDISMPVLNGLQAASHLQSTKSRTRVVFLTVHEDPDFVSAAFSAGATGYVIKPNLSTDLIPAILEATEGRTYISESLQ